MRTTLPHDQYSWPFSPAHVIPPTRTTQQQYHTRTCLYVCLQPCPLQQGTAVCPPIIHQAPCKPNGRIIPGMCLQHVGHHCCRLVIVGVLWGGCNSEGAVYGCICCLKTQHVADPQCDVCVHVCVCVRMQSKGIKRCGSTLHAHLYSDKAGHVWVGVNWPHPDGRLHSTTQQLSLV